MLIQFSVGNFLSFKEQVTLSMVSTSISEFKDTNTFSALENLELIKSSAIYGANASGKSNLLKAMQNMRIFVHQSVEHLGKGTIPWIRNFKFSSETKNEPSFFEVVILINETLYRYGFEANAKQIINEWLYSKEKSKGSEDELFLRTNTSNINIDKKRFKEGKNLNEKTRDNALFLTVAAQFNGEISTRILDWFLLSFNILDALENSFHGVDTKRKVLKDEKFKNVAGNLLRIADFGIEGINVTKEESAPLPFPLPENASPQLQSRINDDLSIKVTTDHTIYNSEGKKVGVTQLDLFRDESEGTKKFFCMLGPVFQTLVSGGVLVVDELDTSLHSRLIWKIVRLFNSKETNPKNAQLIFTTHDTTILSQNFLRRDQMWFAEKNRHGESSLYSLAEFELPVRKDASFEKDYLKGKYGAVPNISSELDQVVTSIYEESSL